MNQLNSVLIEGNAVRDAELKYANSGTAICRLSIAVNRSYKSGDGFEKEVSFFDVDAFGKLAETCAGKCRKGDAVRVVGRLKQDRWNASDGTVRSRVVIVAEHVEFRPKAKERDGQSSVSPDTGDITF
jgi:single-strand DNA-binding protein